MAIDLFFNLLLFLFFGYCMVDSFKLVNLPGADPMGSAMWPQIILALLLVCLLVNMRNIIKKNKAEPDKVEKLNLQTIKKFFTSKLFIGMVLAVALAVLMEPLGFIITCALFVMGYGVLLGMRKYLQLGLLSVGISFLLFFLFSKGLSIMLPRGIGFIRNFTLMLESI